MHPFNASAASSTGQNFGLSKYSLLVWELTMKPLSLSLVSARSISFAARFGACGAKLASPAKRAG